MRDIQPVWSLISRDGGGLPGRRSQGAVCGMAACGLGCRAGVGSSVLGGSQRQRKSTWLAFFPSERVPREIPRGGYGLPCTPPHFREPMGTCNFPFDPAPKSVPHITAYT